MHQPMPSFFAKAARGFGPFGSESALRSYLRWLYFDQVAGFKSEIRRLQQQLSAREDIFRSGLRESLLR
jgi:hypothetical protein